MNDKSILLIGNGPSVLKDEAGSLIDRHPLVCRFNWFRLEKFEKHVGTKCDIWVSCQGEKHIRLRQHMFKKIYFPLSQKHFIEMTKIFPLSECFPQSLFVKVSTMNGGYFYPSSGLLATVFFLDQNYDVILYGFDFFQGSKHHYGDNQPRGENHSPDNEVMAFNQILDYKKLRFLL